MSHGRPLGHPGARERLMIAVSDLFCENDAVNSAIAAWHCSIFFLSASSAVFAWLSSSVVSVTWAVALQASLHPWLVIAALNWSSVAIHCVGVISPAGNFGIGTFPVCNWLLRATPRCAMMLVC